MKKAWKTALISVVSLAGVVGFTAWCAMYRELAQPAWITSDQRDTYFYGSVGSRTTDGVPYWVWLAMPRIFPEHMPGPGGYASLGMSWEEGKEMPIGFAKQRVGYIRVTGNCALCHVISHTTDIKPLLNFLTKCATDPRFNADEFFAEIASDTKLSILDRLIYRYVLIPRARKVLINDPALALLSPELRAHLRDPHSDAPFADQQMKLLKAYMIQQSQTVKH